MLASCFTVLASVLAFNVVVDPFAIAGTHVIPSAVETDRGIKLTLLERLRPAPATLILGSSRARQAEPAFLRTLTRRSGFNAGVTGGTAADAYVFTRYAADLFPAGKRRYIWFVDPGIATNGVNPQLADDPRAKRYLEASGRFRVADVGTYLSTRATLASFRVTRKCVFRTCAAPIRYLPDGSIPHRSRRRSAEHARRVARSAEKIAQAILARPSGGPAKVDPSRYVYFERTLAFMNAHGSRPVIVLNPIYPTILAALERRGFPKRAAGLAYLRKLRSRYDFVFVDCQDIRTWGGTTRDFANTNHVDWPNMRRLLRYVVRHSRGALT